MKEGKNVNDLLTNILLNKEVYQALGNQVLVSTWPIIIELKTTDTIQKEPSYFSISMTYSTWKSFLLRYQ